MREMKINAVVERLNFDKRQGTVQRKKVRQRKKLQCNSRECVTVGLVGLFLFLFSLFSLSLASFSDILESISAAQHFGQMSVLTSAS